MTKILYKSGSVYLPFTAMAWGICFGDPLNRLIRSYVIRATVSTTYMVWHENSNDVATVLGSNYRLRCRRFFEAGYSSVCKKNPNSFARNRPVQMIKEYNGKTNLRFDNNRLVLEADTFRANFTLLDSICCKVFKSLFIQYSALGSKRKTIHRQNGYFKSSKLYFLFISLNFEIFWSHFQSLWHYSQFE